MLQTAPPATRGVCSHPPARGVQERSRRRSEGDCHSWAFLSKTSCFSGAIFLPLRPSPCMVGRDGHCWTWRDGGPLGRLLVGGRAGCSSSRADLPAPSQSVSGQSAVSSQQGCQPRAGERRPWEPGAADLSPPLSTACFSSRTLCVWPGHRVVSPSPVRPSLVTLALSLWWPGPPSLSWAHAHGLTRGQAGSTSL